MSLIKKTHAGAMSASIGDTTASEEVITSQVPVDERDTFSRGAAAIKACLLGLTVPPLAVLLAAGGLSAVGDLFHVGMPFLSPENVQWLMMAVSLVGTSIAGYLHLTSTTADPNGPGQPTPTVD